MTTVFTHDISSNTIQCMVQDDTLQTSCGWIADHCQPCRVLLESVTPSETPVVLALVGRTVAQPQAVCIHQMNNLYIFCHAQLC